jgi:hypothetical protein
MDRHVCCICSPLELPVNIQIRFLLRVSRIPAALLAYFSRLFRDLIRMYMCPVRYYRPTQDKSLHCRFW